MDGGEICGEIGRIGMDRMELNDDMRWCLSWWAPGRWYPGRPGKYGVKKWEDHIRALIRGGLLEADGKGMYRITTTGRVALTGGEYA
jgi:hypothetical protein